MAPEFLPSLQEFAPGVDLQQFIDNWKERAQNGQLKPPGRAREWERVKFMEDKLRVMTEQERERQALENQERLRGGEEPEDRN
jgi:hypothetical protein